MMIQSKYKIAILFLVFTSGIFNQISATVEAPFTAPFWKAEFTKNITKEFNISANGDVTLKNKYGKIDLKTWSQNKVKVEVKITVNARSESDANKLFERIKINFSNGADFVNAETVIESTKKSYWGDGKGDFKIDYVVHMPKSCNINLSNKYGHSTIAEIDGKAVIDVKYGDLSMDGVNNDCKVTLGYGNGTIVKVGKTKLDVKYSKIKINRAANVDVISKYSKVYIDEAGDIKSSSKYDTYRLGNMLELRNEGKYDNFEINNINLINTTSRYSDFNIEKLKKEGDFSLEYGNVVIGALLKNFISLRLDGKYTNFKITTEEGTNYALDVVARYADVKYPSGFEVTYEKQKGASHEVQGYKGSKNASPIKARVEFGGVKIR
jgi:hypothetical protein